MTEAVASPKDVFIVHGRNREVAEAVSQLVKSLGVVPHDFSAVRLGDSFKGRYVGEVLDHAFKMAQAIIVLVSGEEKVRLQPRYAIAEDFPIKAGYQARPNVLIEIGMAIASHKERVIIVEFPPLRPISDLGGLVTLRYNGDDAQFCKELASRLKAAGCDVSDAALPAPSKVSRALKERNTKAMIRHYVPRVVLVLLGLAACLGAAYWFGHPNWCGARCRQAVGEYWTATALWKAADSSKQEYLGLYDPALDHYYKAASLAPESLLYRASVAATLNDLGYYQRMLDEMVPYTKTKEYGANYGNTPHAWLAGEIAAAYAIVGNQQAADEYTRLALETHSQFTGWVQRQIVKYRFQDKLRTDKQAVAKQ